MMNDVYLCKYFCMREFESPDTHQVKLDSEFFHKLWLLRILVNQPFPITSGYRTPEHNKAVGGSPTSYHLFGRAVDLSSKNLRPIDIIVIATRLKFIEIIDHPELKYVHLAA